MSKKGFTLIELLVVIAIIALLMAVIIPSLSLAKKKAASIVCMSNTRQMSMAWYMYQDENDGSIMGSNMEDVGANSVCREAWIGQPHLASDTLTSSLTLEQTSPPVTDEDEIRGIEKGKLYPYVENYDIYHCPADKLRKGPDGTRMYVSYAVPLCLHEIQDRSHEDYSRQINKFSEIRTPGNTFTFVESGERSRGNWTVGGHFIMATPEYGFSEYGLWSPVAISHGDSAVFGFADGHAENKKWHDEIVFEHYEKTEGQPPGALYGQTFAPPGGSEDLDWLVRGWAYKQ